MNSKQTLTDLKQTCYEKLKLSNEAKGEFLVYKKLSTKSFESLLTNRLVQNSCLLPGISGKSFSTISFFFRGCCTSWLTSAWRKLSQLNLGFNFFL